MAAFSPPPPLLHLHARAPSHINCASSKFTFRKWSGGSCITEREEEKETPFTRYSLIHKRREAEWSKPPPSFARSSFSLQYLRPNDASQDAKRFCRADERTRLPPNDVWIAIAKRNTNADGNRRNKYVVRGAYFSSKGCAIPAPRPPRVARARFEQHFVGGESNDPFR